MAKIFQDYVKGKINNTHVPIHFQNKQSDNSAISISPKEVVNNELTQTLKEKSEYTEIDETIANTDYDKTNDIPSSTKSSPGIKPKWSTNVADVKKNIEDAYSSINTYLKDKPDSKSAYASCSSNDEIEKPNNIRSSITMPNMERFDYENNSNIHKAPSLSADKNEADTNESNKTPVMMRKDIQNQKKVIEPTTKTSSMLPANVRKDIIENFEFPTVVVDDKKSKFSKLDYKFFLAIIVLVLAILYCDIKSTLIFIFGNLSCFVLFYHFNLLDFGKNKTLNIKKLKDVKLPQIPHIVERDDRNFDVHSTNDSIFSGWINLTKQYNVNTYNINQCYTIHIDIENCGSSVVNQEKTAIVNSPSQNNTTNTNLNAPINSNRLLFRRPRKRIHRRALYSQEGKEGVGITFMSGELVLDQLDKITITLLPEKLVKKRMWSKKYPIQLTLPKPLGEYRISGVFKEMFDLQSNKLYLFGRTCRQKEEWYRRLLYSTAAMHIELDIWNNKMPKIRQMIRDKALIVTKYLIRPRRGSVEPNSKHHSGTTQNKISTSDMISKRISGGIAAEDDRKKIVFNKCEEECGEDGITIESRSEHLKKNQSPRIAEYVKFMSKFMPSDMTMISSEVMDIDINYISCCDEMLSVNAFIGRLFWDFMRGSHWVEFIKEKIECKLKKIHSPIFVDELKIVEIHLGEEIPIIRKLARPYLDSDGLWVDAEISYSGGVYMVLETKVNLFNIRNQARKNVDNNHDPSGTANPTLHDENRHPMNTRPRSVGSVSATGIKFNSVSDSANRKSAPFESEEEDSADSTTNDEESGDENTSYHSSQLPNLAHNSLHTASPSSTVPQVQSPLGPTINTAAPADSTQQPNSSGTSGSRRFMNIVNKLSQSSYVQKAFESKPVKRCMEMVSNTPLHLNVKLNQLTGTLALNIPPPPSDRLWFGFRPLPTVVMSAKPSVANKEISFSSIVQFIENKLVLEFHRVLVLPNMEDIPLPLLVNGSTDKYPQNL